MSESQQATTQAPGPAAAAAPADGRVVDVVGLRKSYGNFQALAGISFHMGRGEVLGLLGPNGAGKTTTLRILTCNMYASAGEVRVAGFDVATHSLEVRRRVGYLAENAPLYADMRVDEYLDFVAVAHGLKGERREQAQDAVVARCGIGSVWRRPIGQLSKGYRQRVGLAATLVHSPEILILDEPTTGLDPNQIVEIRELIKEIGREKTVILSTHILREVEVTCNRVLIIHQGRIVADDRPERLRQGDVLVARIRGPRAEVEAGLARLSGVVRREVGEAGGGYLSVRLQSRRDAGLAEAVFELARDAGWGLSELRTEDSSLEDVFRQLTEAA